jgi:hypothetical protein
MRLLIVAALLASLAGCAPVPQETIPGKDWDVVITTNMNTYKYRIHTTRPIQQVQNAAAICAQEVHASGPEIVGDCLRRQGFQPIFMMK